MESRDDLMAELALIARQLQASDEPASDLIDALIEVSRALKLPVDEHGADTHRFLEGVEAVETATWKQCAGLVFALEHRQATDFRACASRNQQKKLENSLKSFPARHH